jgi:hypothetical protein
VLLTDHYSRSQRRGFKTIRLIASATISEKFLARQARNWDFMAGGGADSRRRIGEAGLQRETVLRDRLGNSLAFFGLTRKVGLGRIRSDSPGMGFGLEINFFIRVFPCRFEFLGVGPVFCTQDPAGGVADHSPGTTIFSIRIALISPNYPQLSLISQNYRELSKISLNSASLGSKGLSWLDAGRRVSGSGPQSGQPLF